jgi:hypothetical protein
MSCPSAGVCDEMFRVTTFEAEPLADLTSRLLKKSLARGIVM